MKNQYLLEILKSFLFGVMFALRLMESLQSMTTEYDYCGFLFAVRKNGVIFVGSEKTIFKSLD